MEHLSSATVNAIVKQIKDLQKNPAEGITVRFFNSLFILVIVVLMQSAFRRRLTRRRGRLEMMGFRFLFPFLLRKACVRGGRKRAQNAPY